MGIVADDIRQSVKSPWIPALAGMTGKNMAATATATATAIAIAVVAVAVAVAVAVEQPITSQAPEGSAQHVRC